MANSNLLRGQGGGGGGVLTLVHSPAVNPVAEHLSTVEGQLRGSTVLNISDISNFTAITAGTLIIGGETVSGIDLSGATTINEVVTTIDAAVKAVAALANYTVGLDFVNPNFYGRILRSDGDVPAVSGTLDSQFGFSAPGNTVAYVSPSPAIILPAPSGGDEWSHLAFRALGQSYTNQYWHFISDFWANESGYTSHYLAFNNTAGWEASLFADSGEIQVGVAEAYNLAYINFFYDPATRAFSWRNARAQPTQTTWTPSLETLTVQGS